MMMKDYLKERAERVQVLKDLQTELETLKVLEKQADENVKQALLTGGNFQDADKNLTKIRETIKKNQHELETRTRHANEVERIHAIEAYKHIETIVESYEQKKQDQQRRADELIQAYEEVMEENHQLASEYYTDKSPYVRLYSKYRLSQDSECRAIEIPTTMFIINRLMGDVKR